MIRIDNLTKAYDKNIIFEHVNLLLEDNKIYFILGRNGSGKTTFIKCLLNLEQYKGSINYSQSAEKRIFAIYDDIPLYENLNGYDNIRLLTGSDCSSRENINRLQGLLPAILSKKTRYYSLGEKKKLLIMAALLMQPAYLILDEIANGLDIDSLKWLLKQLTVLKENCLILVTGHYLEFYEKLLDEIIVINENSIYQTEQKGGTLYDLYEKLYGDYEKGTLIPDKI